MLEILQDVLIILLAGYMTWDNGSGVQVIGAWPVCTGFVMGLITGGLEYFSSHWRYLTINVFRCYRTWWSFYS